MTSSLGFFSTQTRSWTVVTSSIKVNVLVRVEFSWSIQLGLVLYLDGVEVARTTEYTLRNVTATNTRTLLVGKCYTTGKHTAMTIEGLTVAEAPKAVADAVDQEVSSSSSSSKCPSSLSSSLTLSNSPHNSVSFFFTSLL